MASGSRTHKVLGTAVTNDDMTLKQSMLPTKTEILKCRLAYVRNGLDCRAANNEVIKQIIEIYEWAAIPTISYRGMEKRIDDYIEKFFFKLIDTLVNKVRQNHLE